MTPFKVFLSRVQYLLSLAAVIAVLVYLAQHSHSPSVAIPADADREAAVRVVGPKRITVAPDSPFAKKLQLSKAEIAEITAPLVTVTGVVAACFHSGNENDTGYWQFHSTDLLEAYADWQGAIADTAFFEGQLAGSQLLADAQVEAAKEQVERMQRLVRIGTDTDKDLAEARATLIQTQIEGRRDVHEAQADLRTARQAVAVLERQLEQAGLDPTLLASATDDLDIIIAEVPESWSGRIAIGQSCVAQFMSLPGQQFAGRLHAIVPVLSSERRSLRVLISVLNCDEQLRPGMFAEIGIGTDSREALLAPTDAVIHIGRSDYVLVKESESVWRVTEVSVGEMRNNAVEIRAGLQDGELIAGRGAILLKPLMTKALQTAE